MNRERNVTLLPSQVEAMEKLGNGNLSLGIRKAIDIMEIMNLHITYKDGTTEVIPNIVKAKDVPADGSSTFIEYTPPAEETGGMHIPQRFKPTNLVLTFADGSSRTISRADIANTQYLSDEELASGYTFLGERKAIDMTTTVLLKSRTSGDIYAARLDDHGKVTESIGPLPHDEHAAALAGDADINMHTEDNEYLDGDDFELYAVTPPNPEQERADALAELSRRAREMPE